jgi:hypothetical protein
VTGHQEGGVGLARTIWQASQPACGTLVEQYLIRRFIDVTALGGMPPALLYHPALFNSDIGRQIPAMVAGVQDESGLVVAVHRTFLGLDGCKAPVSNPKKMLGPVWTGAVRFRPAASHIMLCEGIETGLSVWMALRKRRRHTGDYAIWAALSLGNIAGGGEGYGAQHPKPPRGGSLLPSTLPDMARPGVWLPRCVKTVTLLADSDNRDQFAAEALLQRGAARFIRQGLQV